MYDVIFEETKFNLRVKVRSTDSIEDALGFALSLHKSSNVPHVICVEDSESTHHVVFLELHDKKDG